MITLPTSWLYPGKTFRKLVRLDSLDKDSLYHSFLMCTYPAYRSKKYLSEKFLFINRFKMSLISYNKDFEEIIRKDSTDELLHIFSDLFEVNIYLLKCAPEETLIDKTFLYDNDSPTIFIEMCEKFYPVGVNDKYGIHISFYDDTDGEIIRSIESFDKSGISKEYEDEIEDEIKIDTSILLKYNVKDVLNSLKHKKLK